MISRSDRAVLRSWGKDIIEYWAGRKTRVHIMAGGTPIIFLFYIENQSLSCYHLIKLEGEHEVYGTTGCADNCIYV